jgi:hypothetical protein
MWFSYLDEMGVFIPLEVDTVKELYAMNKKGIFPEDLKSYVYTEEVVEVEHDYENVVGQDSLTRFDSKKKKSNKRKPNRPKPLVTATNITSDSVKPTAVSNDKKPKAPAQKKPVHQPNPNAPKNNINPNTNPNPNQGQNPNPNPSPKPNQHRRNKNRNKNNNKPDGGTENKAS